MTLEGHMIKTTPPQTRTLYAVQRRDGSVQLQAPRKTADILCHRHSFVDTHLIARSGAHGLRKAINQFGDNEKITSDVCRRALKLITEHTNATLETADNIVTLTYLGVSVTHAIGNDVELINAWIAAAENYGSEAHDVPENIGTLQVEVRSCP